MRILRIFHADAHPSVMGIGGKKEGFSVLAMLDRCVTAMVRPSALLVMKAHLLDHARPHACQHGACVMHMYMSSVHLCCRTRCKGAMRTDCVQGKQLLRHWMQTPSWDLDEIERRQHAIQLFLDDPDTRQELKGLLKHVRCPDARQ
jgi:MutS domain III